MTAAALVTYWFNVPSFIIGIPASCVVIYAWCRFARTGRKI